MPSLVIYLCCILLYNFQSLNVIFLFIFHIRMVLYLSVRSVVVLHMSSL